MNYKFSMQKDDLAYIFKVMRPALSSSEFRLSHTYIKFVCRDKTVTAYAVDGYRLHSVSFPLYTFGGFTFDDETNVEFLVKPFTLPKTQKALEYINCELTDKTISFDFGDRLFIEKLGVGEFLDVSSAIPSTPKEYEISVNPNFLVDALKNMARFRFVSPAVTLEFYGKSKPIIIRDKHSADNWRIVLPIRGD